MAQDGNLWNRDLQQQIRSVESATGGMGGFAVATRCVEG